MVMMFKLMVVMAAVFVLPSSSHIWEKAKNRFTDFHDRYQVVPPHAETAKKLMHYFLNRPDWSIANLHKRNKRQAFGQEILFDVVFIIDTSGSLSKKKFRQGLEALKLLIPKARPSTKYAAISFSSHAEMNFGFVDANQTRIQIPKIPHQGGKTNTQEALQKATSLFLNTTSGARSGSYRRVLIVTDGQSNVQKEKTLYNAFILKSLGVEIFVVAVGKYIKGIVEIVGMASSTNAHLYRVEDLEGLLQVVRLIPQWKDIQDYNKKTWLSNMYADSKKHR